jgi:integrase/recombinase XerD
MFPVCRETIFKYFKGKSNGLVNPHLLRHTCATNLIASGADIYTTRDILGHNTTRTTEIYIHTANEARALAVARVESDKTTWFDRLKERLFPSKKTDILPMAFGQTSFHVGRKAELERLLDLYEKKVNTLILAPQGFGKSHLLDNFQTDNLLRIDDCREFRKTLANLIIKICKEDKETVAELLNIDPSVITRESQKRLVQILCQITQKNEYTILIDDATTMTPTAIKALEGLRGHFHFIVAARQIETKNASWLTNFERIDLGPLNRVDAIELIVRLSENFREKIQDFEQFKNHVWRQTNGVPQFIVEMVERYQKEDSVSIESIATINHTAGRGEIDAMPFVLLLFGSLVVLKFYAKEAMEGDKEAFMIMGAIGLLAVMFGRHALRSLKRKFI